jgi:signal recognition particle subunit SRP54
VMDSMTTAELDSDGKPFNMQPSRLARVARGSGTSKVMVAEVLESYKPFGKLAGKMGELGKMGMDVNKGMGGPGAGRGGRGPNAMDLGKQMASILPPQAIQKMGGLGNLQNMMAQFSESMGMGGKGGLPGGMPGGGDMAAMMKMMQNMQGKK